MKKYFMLFVLIFIIIFFIILITKFNNLNSQYILKGTFISDDFPFSTMVFDIDGKYTFNFYNYDFDLRAQRYIDNGTFFNKTKSTYIINSECLNNKEIIYNKSGIEIIINNKRYVFKKISDIPIIID